MAKVIGQDIPSWAYDDYKDILTIAVPHRSIKYGEYVRVFPSWREKLYTFATEEYKKIPPGRLAVWVAFKQACECWWKQKEEGNCWPPDIGPRDMQYWNMESLYERMGIFQFYMHKSIRPFYRGWPVPWCEYGPKRDVHVDRSFPDTNYAESPELWVNTSYGEPVRRFFIMKDEDEYDYTYLHIYCTNVQIGVNYQTPIIATWNIRQNFINELRITWEDQPYLYDELTYQTVSEEGWVHIYTGKDWNAFGVAIFSGLELQDEYRFGARFASMNYALPAYRPYWA